MQCTSTNRAIACMMVNTDERKRDVRVEWDSERRRCVEACQAKHGEQQPECVLRCDMAAYLREWRPPPGSIGI